jgi:hypothetical protein
MCKYANVQIFLNISDLRSFKNFVNLDCVCIFFNDLRLCVSNAQIFLYFMQQRRELEKKRTNIVEFTPKRDAVMEVMDAGPIHVEAISHVNEKLAPMKRKTIIDFVKELGPNNIDPKADLKELYYQDPKHGGGKNS